MGNRGIGLLFFLLWCFSYELQAQQLSGRVLSSADQSGLAGASIRMKGKNIGVIADSNGYFKLPAGAGDTLLVSFVGYYTKEVAPPLVAGMLISVKPTSATLTEVMVSTGYQVLPKERATGSFVQVDNALLNRTVGNNVIERLRDVVPGLSFNRVGNSSISIRGQSTIFGNAEPLVVVDNFPFEGNILDISPNDVEGITVLKDAAAASIWGARAANGVIVVTTKKGRQNQGLKVAFHSNLSVGALPDLYQAERLSSADYIEIEKRLFDQGFYQTTRNTGYLPVSPAVELFYRRQANPSQASAIDAELALLGQQDVRQQLQEYVYQRSLLQNYSVNFSGGAQFHSYFLSLGHDSSRENLRRNGSERTTLNFSQTFKLLNHRLEISSGLALSYGVQRVNNIGSAITNATLGNALFPYAQLADENGLHLPLVKNYDPTFITGAKANGLLDWQYVPLDEIELADNRQTRRNLRLTGTVRYKVIEGLSASINYQFNENNLTGNNYYDQESYFARDLINRFTQVSGSTLIRPIPLGGILDRSSQQGIAHAVRLQVDYSKKWNGVNEFTAIGGAEVRDTRTEGDSYRYYGYDAMHAQSGIVDYTDNMLPLYFDPLRRGQVPNVDDNGIYNDRNRSWYANASYTYLGRYTISGSGRLDQSNLFGVTTNQKGVPLWSVGLSWNISREKFYRLGLPYLKLRATYGYNGSVDKSVSAFTTASLTGLNLYQQPYATIINPPNPSLRWERVSIANLGLDFGAKGNRITGSVEYYHKRGIDLIGDTPFPPSSGITLFRGNAAGTRGNGIDVSLTSRNLTGALKWQTDVVFSHIREKVDDYQITAAVSSYIQSGIPVPLEGRPLFALYSYEWAGLDPLNGDPMGLLNGVPSKDYVGLLGSLTPETMQYHGARRPTTFGSVRNTLDFRQWSLSFNITYSLGYFFRKPTVSYGNNYGLLANHSDYAKRWRQPGDEQSTVVPSLPMTANNNRDLFYRYSSALVDRADNVRLQDIRLGYRLGSGKQKGFPTGECYLLATNLGMVWKASKFGLDPENQRFNQPMVISLGFRMNVN